MMNSPEVYRAVAQRTGLSYRRARLIVNAVTGEIGNALAKGEIVRIPNFGRFKLHHYPSKSISDPQGRGHQILVLERNVIKFRPSIYWRQKVKNSTQTNMPPAKPPIKTNPPDTVDTIQLEPAANQPPKKTPNLLILFDKIAKNKQVANSAATVANKEKPIDPKLKAALEPVDIAIRDLSDIRVPKETLNILPELFARRHKAVPIEVNSNAITVAMVDPENVETVQLIKKSTGLDVVPVLASSDDVNHILNQYSGLEKEVEAVVKDSELDINKKVIAEAQNENVEMAGDDSPTSRIVLSLLRRAVREKASDIHIEPQENTVVVRFRIDGVLRVRIKLPTEIQSAIISRLKILANLKIDEHRLPQDGRFQIPIDKNNVDFRLSILPVANGEKAVMRVLDKSQGILTLEEIGVRGQAYDVVRENIKKSFGMTLVCGPTGSGKTTTQYALLGQLMDVGVNIVTLENPIEYRIEGINQSQVNPDIKYDFADGLRAIVRQDPDIIMVGEIRDKETAEIAIQSALTGHIVLSTLHTNNAGGAFPRLIDMGVEPFLISSSINTVIAQRLARKLCDHCKQEYKPSPQEVTLIQQELAKVPSFKAPKTFTFYSAKGCDACNDTGYKGRVGVFEVLGLTENIKELVLQSSPDSKITELAIKNGMITMLQDGVMKAIDGITSLEEVWRVTKD